MVQRGILAGALLCALSIVPASAQRRLKVYISADMEGVTGVVSGDQLSPPLVERETISDTKPLRNSVQVA